MTVRFLLSSVDIVAIPWLRSVLESEAVAFCFAVWSLFYSAALCVVLADPRLTLKMMVASKASFLLAVVLPFFSLLVVRVHANLSSLCCGDNFCCAILASTGKATCWGGNSMSAKVPTSAVKALTCGGKAVMGVDVNMHRLQLKRGPFL